MVRQFGKLSGLQIGPACAAVTGSATPATAGRLDDTSSLQSRTSRGSGLHEAHWGWDEEMSAGRLLRRRQGPSLWLLKFT